MMKFERGKDPKEVMGIGLKAQVLKAMEDLVDEMSYQICDENIRETTEKNLSKKFGINISLVTKADICFKIKGKPLRLYYLYGNYPGLDKPIKVAIEGSTLYTNGWDLVSKPPRMAQLIPPGFK